MDGRIGMDGLIGSNDERRRRWAGIVAGAGALLMVAAAGIAAVSAASPADSPPVLPGEPGVPWDDGATPAEVRADLVDVGPRTWEHVLLAPDGRTATVYFWMGPAECDGLAGIDVTPTGTGYRILVSTGAVPGAQVCPDVARLYRSVVVLDERILSGGELLDLPGGSVRAAG